MGLCEEALHVAADMKVSPLNLLLVHRDVN